MKLSITLVVFMLVFNSLHAQHSFKFRLEKPVNERIMCLIEQDNGSFLAVGFQGTPWEKWDYQGLIISMSSAGDTSVKRYKASDTAFTFTQVIKSGDGMFFVFGNAFIPPDYDEGKLLMAKIDTGLNLLWYKTYKLPVIEVWPRRNLISKNRESFHLFSEVHTTIHYRKTMICKLSRQGILENYTILENNNTFQSIEDAVWSRDSSEFYLTGMLLQGVRSSRVVYDTNYNYCFGNYISEEADFNTTLKWYSDSTLLLSANTNIPTHENIVIGITDTSFANISFNEIGSVDTADNVASLKSFDFRHPDSIWLAGTHHDHYGLGIPSWISVYQLDSNLNPRSVNYFGGDMYYNTFNVLATSDGGCLLSAVYDDYEGPQQFDVFIIKLKRDEIITFDELISDGSETLEYNLFPNPGRDKMRIHSNSKGMQLQLFNLNGQQVIQLNLQRGVNTIDCSDLPGGTYIYSLYLNNAPVNSGRWVKL